MFSNIPEYGDHFRFFLTYATWQAIFLDGIKILQNSWQWGGKPRSFRRFSTSPVFPELDPPHVLLVDEVGGHRVLGGVVPRGEDLLPGKLIKIINGISTRYK